MFSETVLATLKSAGWFPNRKVSVETWIERLSGEGFTMNRPAIEILGNFGGLTIHPPMNPANDCRPSDIKFDPIVAASGEFDRVECWQERLGVALSPIAQIYVTIVLVVDDGRVYFVFDDALFYVASSFEDALENAFVIERKRPVEVGWLE